MTEKITRNISFTRSISILAQKKLNRESFAREKVFGKAKLKGKDLLKWEKKEKKNRHKKREIELDWLRLRANEWKHWLIQVIKKDRGQDKKRDKWAIKSVILEMMSKYEKKKNENTKRFYNRESDENQQTC